MPNAPAVELITDPREIRYLLQRRKVRRRYLAATVASAVLVLGYFGWRVGSHVIAANWLETNQFTVIWDVDKSNWRQGGVTTVRYGRGRGFLSFFAASSDNRDLRFLTWLNRIVELNLSYNSNLKDEDLSELGRLTDLRILDLDKTRSSAVRAVDGLGKLTDVTLARIKDLKHLEQLNIGGQRITDAGLANLEGLDQLKTLDIRWTRITDAGLEHLRRLPRLKALDLTGTNVTFEGVRAFEADRPGVTVLSDAAPPTSKMKRPAPKPEGMP